MKKIFHKNNVEDNEEYTEDDLGVMDLDAADNTEEEYFEEEYFEIDDIEEEEYLEADDIDDIEEEEYLEADDIDDIEEEEYLEAEDIDDIEEEEYLEADDIDDIEEEYYEADEYYEAEEYEGDEYYADEDGEDDEYYEMDEYGDENEYGEDDEYYYEEEGGYRQESGSLFERIIAFLANMSGMDRAIAVTGVLVLVFAIVVTTVFANTRLNSKQVEAFAGIGSELENVHVIGESGLLAVADAKRAKEEAAALAVQEEEQQEEEEQAGEIEVTMNLSSIQQDLKIKFINKKTSKLIASVPFEVEVTDAEKKTYSLIDEDMDGIIYQTGLTGGKYTVKMVKLDEYKTYEITEEAQQVTVKDKIEYKKVDVADEIKTESEVNASVEDTKKQETVESANTDTVAFVESTKTEVGEGGYNEISKSSITDPATVASRLRLGDFTKLMNVATNTVALKRGESTVIATALGGDYITWLSSDNSIAGVDTSQTGATTTITANAAGTAVITAGNGTDTETWQVSVTETQIALDKQTATVYVGQTITIGATGGVTWTSSDTSVATVDGNGTVTGIKNGTAAITATAADGASATCVVTVSSSATTISPASASIKVGGTTALSVTVVGNDKAVAWTSSDASVATVSVVGVVTGVKAGTATITATANGISSTCTVTVTADNANTAANDTKTALKDNNGNQVYIVNAAGEYVAAVYADYYKYDKFYIKSAQYKYTGWQTIEGSVYYYDANGNVVKGTQVIQGATYTFDATTGALVTSSGILGIDVSKWNGSIDWNAVKNSGVNYVIIRCGYRGSTTGALIEDPKFKTNIQGASAAGLKVGVYFFSQAVNEVEAVEEASMVLSLIGGYKLSYPVFLDVEPSGGRADGISTAVRTAVCNAFCQTISNSGYAAGVYANKSWLEGKINTGSIGSSYKIWLAQYAAKPTYAGRHELWQYTSKGSVNGISGDVDLNLSYLGY